MPASSGMIQVDSGRRREFSVAKRTRPAGSVRVVDCDAVISRRFSKLTSSGMIHHIVEDVSLAWLKKNTSGRFAW